jgi:exosortase N
MNDLWAILKKHSSRIVFVACIVSLLLTAVVCLRTFLAHQLFHLLLGLLAIPFVMQTRPEKGTYRFAAVALMMMALSCFLPVYTLVYFALLSILLYLVECHFGRVNFPTIVVVILTTPIATYLANTFSFPIRLWLTSVCGRIFRAAGIAVETAGNTLMYEGADYTVDPACMGLNMLIASLIIGLLLWGYHQKRHHRELPAWLVCVYLLWILALSIFSNLVRMMLLVFFHIFPGVALHDAVGILCLLAQVVLPAWLTCRVVFASPKTSSCAPVVAINKMRFATWLQVVCCVLLWMSALRVVKHNADQTSPVPAPSFAGYTTTRHSREVIKLENDTALIYIKRIRWFCDTEHSPMICWSGSGYRMTQVREVALSGMTVYTGILQRGTDRLYTAWWYSNGLSATHRQLKWRRDMLVGAPAYVLLNVTTASRASLETEIDKIDKASSVILR